MINSAETFPFSSCALKSGYISPQFQSTSPFSSSSSSTSFSSPSSESISGASAKSNKIPRPLNSFMIFRLEKQKDIVDKCPGANHRDISRIISKWWKELGKTEKQRYIDEAEKRKVEHKAMYPDYKFCPKKRIGKPRAYKKRAKTESVARVFENKQSLSALFNADSVASSLSSSDNENDGNSIASDPKQASESPVDSKVYKLIEMEPTPSVSTSSIDSSTDEFSACLPTLPQIKLPELYNSDLYYPSTTSYYTVPPGAYSVPSQSTAYFYSSVGAAAANTITRTEPLINYNIYDNYYGAPNHAFAHSSYMMGDGNPALAAADVDASNALHHISPSQYFLSSLPSLASCVYPYDSYNSNAAGVSTNSSTASSDTASITPHLLAQSFAYPS